VLIQVDLPRPDSPVGEVRKRRRGVVGGRTDDHQGEVCAILGDELVSLIGQA
jgi:hypothetical protein